MIVSEFQAACEGEHHILLIFFLKLVYFKIWVAVPGYGAAAARAYSYQCVQYFCVFRQWYGCFC